MKIHEYQAKEVLRQYGVATPKGQFCSNSEEAVAAAKALGGTLWVVKAQIHAGGRGKGGGVKIARSLAEVSDFSEAMLGMQLVTHQTGAKGQTVRRLLVEEGLDIDRELYLAIVLDRVSQKVCVMGSSEGGMDIEEVSATTPEKIHRILVEPNVGLTRSQADELGRAMGVPENALVAMSDTLMAAYKTYWDKDASLVEINPLILTKSGAVLALDAKFNFDSNALYRQTDIVEMRDLAEEDPAEVEASTFDLSYISLDGDIACLVNGAGLAMATMDTIKLYGGNPANFLDVGGGASKENVTGAFKIMLSNPEIKAILINIFGGIMRCDVIAEGIVSAAHEVDLHVPLVVRMKGTNEQIGKEILQASGLNIIHAQTIGEAAQKIVSAAQ